MISKQKLKDYQFSSIGDYYSYICESYENGQFSQVRSLFKSLSQEQKRVFKVYLREWDYNFSFQVKLLEFLKC